MQYLMRSMTIVLECQRSMASDFHSKQSSFLGFVVVLMHYGSSQANSHHSLESKMLHCIVKCLLGSVTFYLWPPEVNDLCFCATISENLCIFENLSIVAMHY